MPKEDSIVLERLLQRKKKIKDDYKIGLIFEGGGMRGAFSSGAACGLERLGLREAFDVVYGSSAGSCAAVYFLSGEIEKGTTIYAEDLSGLRFIKPWNFSEMMDLDYLCDHVFRQVKPVNVEKLKNATTLLKIYGAEAESGKMLCYTNKDDVDIIEVVKASCSAPKFCHPVQIKNNNVLDGNAVKKLPIEEAIKDGCTDILVVTTVPEKYREPKKSRIGLFDDILMHRLHKRFRKIYSFMPDRYNEELDIAFGVKEVKGVNIFTISPLYHAFEAEISYNKLKKLSDHGIEQAISAFERVGEREKVNY